MVGFPGSADSGWSPEENWLTQCLWPFSAEEEAWCRLLLYAQSSCQQPYPDCQGESHELVWRDQKEGEWGCRQNHSFLEECVSLSVSVSLRKRLIMSWRGPLGLCWWESVSLYAEPNLSLGELSRAHSIWFTELITFMRQNRWYSATVAKSLLFTVLGQQTQVRWALLLIGWIPGQSELICLYVVQAEQMEKKQHEELELSPGQWRKGKKSTFRHVGDDTTRLEIWIHPSHPRSSQGAESGKDSEQENGLGSLSPSDVSSWGWCYEQD